MENFTQSRPPTPFQRDFSTRPLSDETNDETSNKLRRYSNKNRDLFSKFNAFEMQGQLISQIHAYCMFLGENIKLLDRFHSITFNYIIQTLLFCLYLLLFCV